MEEMPSRIAFIEMPVKEIAWGILDDPDRFEIHSAAFKSGVIQTSKDLSDRELDLAIHLRECGDVNRVELIFDGSSDRSLEARTRITEIIDIQQMEILKASGEQILGYVPELTVISTNLSSVHEKSKFLLGLLLPMLIVIITVMGGLYPAIEVIVSERERQTLETTLMAPVNGMALITGKFLAVVFMSVMAATLNVISILLTLKHTLLLGMGASDLQFKFPISAIPLILLGTVLVASVFSAAMILLASFAKNFKEGQSMVTPLYAVGIQPAVVSAIPTVPFNNLTACIPVTNVSLMFRALIQGNCPLLPMLITFANLILWCAVLLFIAKRMLNRDSVVLGLNKKQFFKWKFLSKRGKKL